MAKCNKRLNRLFEAQSGKCFYCKRQMNRKPNHDHAASVDHIRPRIFGGLRRVINTVACCRVCNSEKGPLTVDQFLRLRDVPEKLKAARRDLEMRLNPR